jgi:hypothetical protein
MWCVCGLVLRFWRLDGRKMFCTGTASARVGNLNVVEARWSQTNDVNGGVRSQLELAARDLALPSRSFVPFVPVDNVSSRLNWASNVRTPGKRHGDLLIMSVRAALLSKCRPMCPADKMYATTLDACADGAWAKVGERFS